MILHSRGTVERGARQAREATTMADKRLPTIPDDGYLDGGEPYTQEEFEAHDAKMARFRQEHDARANEDEILEMMEA